MHNFNLMDDEIVHRADLGLHVIDRPMSSCSFRTPLCTKTCYMKKFYQRLPKGMARRDARLEPFWLNLTGEKLAQLLSKRRNIFRFRFASRGEILAATPDIARMEDILEHCPGTVFMIPTKAWRGGNLWHQIKKRIVPYPNARVLASIDPSVANPRVLNKLLKDGVSTMFYGDDEFHPLEELGIPVVKCVKTWDHLKYACRTCKQGCFNDAPVHVWLKQH